MTQELYDKNVWRNVPALNALDEIPAAELVAHIHLFSPIINWDWYVLECDPDSGECFGIVNGYRIEFGNFNLNDLQGFDKIMGLPIVERDLSWAPTLLRDIPQVGEFIDMINRASPTK